MSASLSALTPKTACPFTQDPRAQRTNPSGPRLVTLSLEGPGPLCGTDFRLCSRLCDLEQLARPLPNLHLNEPLLNPVLIAKTKSSQSLSTSKKPNHLQKRIHPATRLLGHAHTIPERERQRICRQSRERNHERSRSGRIRQVGKVSQKEIHRRRTKRPSQNLSRRRCQPCFCDPPPPQIVAFQTWPGLPPQSLEHPRSFQIAERTQVEARAPDGIVPVRYNFGHLHERTF
jgi:hypothetical protein